MFGVDDITMMFIHFQRKRAQKSEIREVGVTLLHWRSPKSNRQIRILWLVFDLIILSKHNSLTHIFTIPKIRHFIVN